MNDMEGGNVLNIKALDVAAATVLFMALAYFPHSRQPVPSYVLVLRC